MTEFDMADEWEEALNSAKKIDRVSRLWEIFDDNVNKNNLRRARLIIHQIADEERVPVMKQNVGEYIKICKTTSETSHFKIPHTR